MHQHDESLSGIDRFGPFTLRSGPTTSQFHCVAAILSKRLGMALRCKIAATFCLFLLGCSGSSRQCVEETRQLGALTATSPGGVSGQELLARAGQMHMIELREELSSSRNDVKTSALGVKKSGTLRILPTGASYQIVLSSLDNCLGGSCGEQQEGLVCLDRLELPVQVMLESDDGMFQEQWYGMLTAGAPSDPELVGEGALRQVSQRTAQLRIKVDPQAFAGSFRVIQADAPAGYRVLEHSMSLQLRFDAGALVEGKLVSDLTVESDRKSLELRETDVWIARS